jgi:nucleotide-binding universal stress UspA family protein
MPNWSAILCAVDFSPSSRDALEQAADLARRLDAELTLLHVIERPRVAGTDILPTTERADAEQRERERELEAWKQDAERTTGRPVRVALAVGSAPEEILRRAAEGGFDLVVTGTEARRGLRRMLLGSVAERVVRAAPCAVLVARVPPDWGD